MIDGHQVILTIVSETHGATIRIHHRQDPPTWPTLNTQHVHVQPDGQQPAFRIEVQLPSVRPSPSIPTLGQRCDRTVLRLRTHALHGLMVGMALPDRGSPHLPGCTIPLRHIRAPEDATHAVGLDDLDRLAGCKQPRVIGKMPRTPQRAVHGRQRRVVMTADLQSQRPIQRLGIQVHLHLLPRLRIDGVAHPHPHALLAGHAGHPQGSAGRLGRRGAAAIADIRAPGAQLLLGGGPGLVISNAIGNFSV